MHQTFLYCHLAKSDVPQNPSRKKQRKQMIRITKAKLKDSKDLSHLLLLLMQQEADFSPQIDVHQKGIEMIIASPEAGCILTLKDDEKLIGMIGILYSISTALGAKVAIFEDFIIRQEYRKQGLGQRLFAQAVATARQAACKRITLLTDKDNTRAKHFYSQQGMQASAMQAFRLMI